MSKLSMWNKVVIGMFLIVLICICLSGRELWDKLYIIVMLLCWSANGFIMGLEVGRKEHEI